MVPSLLLFFHLREGWAKKPPPSTRGSPQCYLRNGTSTTLSFWGGCEAPLGFLCYIQPPSALEGHDPHGDAQYTNTTHTRWTSFVSNRTLTYIDSYKITKITITILCYCCFLHILFYFLSKK